MTFPTLKDQEGQLFDRSGSENEWFLWIGSVLETGKKFLCRLKRKIAPGVHNLENIEGATRLRPLRRKGCNWKWMVFSSWPTTGNSESQNPKCAPTRHNCLGPVVTDSRQSSILCKTQKRDKKQFRNRGYTFSTIKARTLNIWTETFENSSFSSRHKNSSQSACQKIPSCG